MTLLMLTLLIPSLSAEGEPASPPEIVYEKFGQITVRGRVYDHDIVIERGEVRKRKKGPSKKQRDKYGHTPLTPQEAIPWKCKTLVIGTGMYGRLPVVPELEAEAERRHVQLVILKTKEAVEYFHAHFGPEINAIFHITC